MATRKNATAKTPDAAQERSNLRIAGDERDREKLIAKLATEGVATNAILLRTFNGNLTGDVGLTETIHALRDTIGEVKGGDLGAAETLLVTQAAALNAMFGELARRAASNMGQYLGATETYMRMALKAQNQCRMTLETLATIKNPPVVFARQANINNGGQQQVNNGGALAPGRDPAHAVNLPVAPTELLEAQNGEWVDTGAAGADGRTDPRLEAVGAVNRPAHS